MYAYVSNTDTKSEYTRNNSIFIRAVVTVARGESLVQCATVFDFPAIFVKKRKIKYLKFTRSRTC